MTDSIASRTLTVAQALQEGATLGDALMVRREDEASDAAVLERLRTETREALARTANDPLT